MCWCERQFYKNDDMKDIMYDMKYIIWKTLKRKQPYSITLYQKNSFGGVLTNEKLAGINVLNA